MKKALEGFGNTLYLMKPYWKHGKLYLIGRMAIEVLIVPALALLQVRLLQSVLDAIAAGATLEATIWRAAVLVGSMLGLTLLRWSFLLLYDRWKAAELQGKINRSIYEQAIATDYQYLDDPDFYNSFTFAARELAAKSESALQLLTHILGTLSVTVAMTAYLSALGPWVIVISVLGQGVCLYAQGHMQRLGIQKATEALPYDRKLHYVHRVAYEKQYAADMKTTRLAQAMLTLFDASSAGKIGVYKKIAAPNWGWNVLQFAAWHLCQLAQLAYMIVCLFVGNLPLGTVAGMFAAAGKLNDMLNQFVGIAGNAMEISLYARQIRGFFTLPSSIEQAKGGLPPPVGAFSLDIRGLSFAYPKGEPVLRDIDISIKPYEKIAIVGENGAGKTTLAKLLLRLYDAGAGEICFNAVPIGAYDIHELRRKIGVAFQDPQLYALTVRENMTLYHPAADEALYKALGKAGLTLEPGQAVTREFDEKGILLSGGQAQRLGLCRLLHGEFGLLLLDEPSSALDPLAEHEMTRLIFEQSPTTTIMVAHRLSTVRKADRILLIAGGRVAEQGTHSQLMALGGRYARMFTKQGERYTE